MAVMGDDAVPMGEKVAELLGSGCGWRVDGALITAAKKHLANCGLNV
jgi:hypothetical protein